MSRRCGPSPSPALPGFTLLLLTSSGRTITHPISQMEKLRHREVASSPPPTKATGQVQTHTGPSSQPHHCVLGFMPTWPPRPHGMCPFPLRCGPQGPPSRLAGQDRELGRGADEGSPGSADLALGRFHSASPGPSTPQGGGAGLPASRWRSHSRSPRRPGQVWGRFLTSRPVCSSGTWNLWGPSILG